MFTEDYYREKVMRLENALKAAAKKQAEIYEVLTTNLAATTLTPEDIYNAYIHEFDVDNISTTPYTYYEGEVVAAPVTYMDVSDGFVKVSEFHLSCTVIGVDADMNVVKVKFSEKTQQKALELLGKSAHLINPDGTIVSRERIVPMNVGSTIYVVD